MLERFAARLHTRVLGWIERDPLVREAEYVGSTVVEYAPTAPISIRYRELACCSCSTHPPCRRRRRCRTPNSTTPLGATSPRSTRQPRPKPSPRLDAGFDVEIQAYAESMKPGGVGLGGRLLLEHFDAPEMLRGRMCTDGVAAWFSDFRDDTRIRSAGKPQFSLAHFRVGFAGAVEGARQLLAVAGTPCFARYRRSLGARGVEDGLKMTDSSPLPAERLLPP